MPGVSSSDMLRSSPCYYLKFYCISCSEYVDLWEGKHYNKIEQILMYHLPASHTEGARTGLLPSQTHFFPNSELLSLVGLPQVKTHQASQF